MKLCGAKGKPSMAGLQGFDSLPGEGVPHQGKSSPDTQVVLEARNLTKEFARGGSVLLAVSDVSLLLKEGECLGVVGESGCGKSTLVNMLAGLLAPTKGDVLLDGESVVSAQSRRVAMRKRSRQARKLYRSAQIVFQDPVASFDPRRTMGYSLIEGLFNQGIDKAGARAKVLALLEECGLDESLLSRYPQQLSGGQCQRAAIARALSVDPRVLICDEATSSLDVSTQAHFVDLLRRVRASRGMALVFVCHDLALVAEMCDRVAVMRNGAIIETGATGDVLGNPQHAYTKLLVDSVL